MTDSHSHSRRRRLLERARRSEKSNPQLCLDSVETLMATAGPTQELLLLRARSLQQLSRQVEASLVWKDVLADAHDVNLELEALRFYLVNFDYASMKRLLASLQDRIPTQEDALVLCARAAQAVRQSSLALDLCKRLVALCPSSPVHSCKLGSMYQSFGCMEEAQTAFARALSIDRDFQPAWYFLAQLRKWEPGLNHIDELRNCLERQQSMGYDTSPTEYALAKELEDLGLYADSFKHLHSGSMQVRKRSTYDVKQDIKLFRDLQDWYLKGSVADSTEVDDTVPIFILGMPRTGSTLSDRILSSHSEVESVGELMCFRRAVEEVCGGQGEPDFFATFFESASADIPFSEIGARYLEMLSPLIDGRRYFIDKMPMNYVFVGLIAKALPAAKFIHTKRNSMDTCFSNYKQMFGEGYYGYSYDLKDLAQHYLLYRQLMAFWHEQLPGRIIDLEYEKLVAEPEREVRALLEQLDLSWQPECLQFHRNTSAVNTASVSQVRRPIYSASVEKWRKFSDQLAPLQEALSTDRQYNVGAGQYDV